MKHELKSEVKQCTNKDQNDLNEAFFYVYNIMIHHDMVYNT